MYIQSQKHCALSVITTMTLWKLMKSCTWALGHMMNGYIYYIFKLVKDNFISVNITMFY